MPVPNEIATDDFNRADGPLGANWTNITNEPYVENNTFLGSGAAFTTYEADHNTSIADASGVWAQVELGSWGPNSQVHVSLGDGTDRYYFSGSRYSWVGYRLYRNGTTLAENLANAPLAGTHRLEHVGGILTAYVDGVEVLSIADDTITPTYGGLKAYRRNAGLTTMDNFSAGNWAAPPNIIATDDFNRADEDPLSDGGNWTNAGFGNLAVVSNAVTNTIAGQWAYSLRTGEALADDQWAEVTTGPVQGGAPLALFVRAATIAEPWVIRGYAVNLEDGGLLELEEFLDGSRTVLASTAWGYFSSTVPHVVRLEAVGTTITVYIDGVVALTTTNASLTGGSAGIGIFGTPGPSATLDNFSAGDWTAAGPPPPPPPPSGHIFKIWNGSAWVAAVLKSGAGWPVVSLGNI